MLTVGRVSHQDIQFRVNTVLIQAHAEPDIVTDFTALSITALLSRMHGLLVYRLLWLRNMVRSLIGCTCDTLKPERLCQVINFTAISFGSIPIISLPFIFESIILYSVSFQPSALKVSSQSPVNFCFSIRNKQKLIPTAHFFKFYILLWHK